MKKRVFLSIITILFPCICFSQWFESSWNGGTLTGRGGINGSSSSYSLSRDDVWSGPSSSRSSSGNNRGNSSSSSSENTYSGPEFIGSWGGNSTISNRFYEAKKEGKEWEKEGAKSVLNEMKQLLRDDCIDINRLQKAIDDYNHLSDYQRRFLSTEGDHTRAYLMGQLHNMKPEYFKYSNMATDIKRHYFNYVDKRMMQLSYENLDRYLKQFLSKEDFETAKAEYKTYEKAKALEIEIDALYAHLNDKKYLREHCKDVDKKMLLMKIRKGMDYFNINILDKWNKIKKVLEYDELKKIPLTISNIDTKLKAKEATKNNANWEKISEGMTNQRLLAILGTLNSDNGNVLPNYIEEKDGNYIFEGEPIETDSKTITKKYIVSKDGSRVEIREKEGVASVAGESFVDNSGRFVNTDLYYQEKQDVYNISANGMVNKFGAGASAGVKSGVEASFDTDKEKASIGIGAEAGSFDFSIAVRKEPVMIVNMDQSVSFKQESEAVGIGYSIGIGVGASFSASYGLHVDTPTGSFSLSKVQPNIDGALKQIDSTVALRIIKSSIDNGNYKSEFKDENIGRTVVSSIRIEADDALSKQKR